MKKTSGFTLVELIATLTLLILLIFVAANSIGNVYKKNQSKTNMIAMNNILRGVEDYVVKNKINIAVNVPLFFSINGLVQQNILSKDANETIKEIKKITTNDSFYVEVTKPTTKSDLNLKVITADDFADKTGFPLRSELLSSTWNIDYRPSTNNNSTTLINREKSMTKVKFKLAKTANNFMYNLFINKVNYQLIIDKSFYNQSYVKGAVIKSGTVKNLSLDQQGVYSFNLNTNVNPGIYHLYLELDTESHNKINSDSNYLTIIIGDSVNKELVTSVSKPSDIWYNLNSYQISVWGKREITNEYADKVMYYGYRYPTINDKNNKTNGVPIGSKTSPIVVSANQLSAGKEYADITFTTSGIYELWFTTNISAERSATNQSISSINEESVVLKLDNVLPTVSISPSTTAWTNGIVTLTCNASDTNSGLASQTFTTKVVTTNGTHSCTAIDYAGNTRTTSYTVSNIDKTAPTIPTWTATKSNGTSYTSGTWTNLNVTWTGFNASDSGSGIDHYEYSNCSDNTWNLLGASYTYNVDLNWAFCIRAVDKVGNASSQSAAFNVRIDKTAPSCTSRGGSTTWTSGNRTIYGDCLDTGSGCVTNPISNTYSSSISTSAASPGSVSDYAGNTTTCPANQTVKIDKTSPSVSASCTGTSSFNASRSDTWSGVASFTYSEKYIYKCEYGRSYKALQRTYTAKDRVGHTTSKTATCAYQQTQVLC